MPQEMFFGGDVLPLSRADIRAAEAVCLGCPVRLSCLFTGLENREPFGIWGGLTTKVRMRLLRNSGGDPQAALSAYLAGRIPSP